MKKNPYAVIWLHRCTTLLAITSGLKDSIPIEKDTTHHEFNKLRNTCVLQFTLHCQINPLEHILLCKGTR